MGNNDKPSDAIRRKITIYIEGSPEEIAKFHSPFMDLLANFPDKLLLRFGPNWKQPKGHPPPSQHMIDSAAMERDEVLKLLDAMAGAGVEISQPFIDPITPDEYFPDMAWRVRVSDEEVE